MNYYDANAVANESAAARYTNHEPPTLCDCGSIAEHGQVYCPVCMDTIDFIMRNAVKLLIHNTGFTEDQAEQAVCHWLENTEEFKERRNAKKL
ncbi:hypothetical protein NIA71_19665 [Ihubacter massiliensis]|uniref:hypothetical protein n=1 Tax=Ihubacter massiliensis TaxID=1852367 RepID=UPI002097D325|nr:hypothetical protein [Ihubacter massiliensis]MCO7124139.1 hypothetical protein [Ihubacter massiliensis]MDY3013510.1 hypothetical protein [Clostridiales Family XIII bacterium]